MIGGANPDGPLRTTERYDPRADRWRTLRPLLTVGRASFSADLVRGSLIAFGGFEINGGPPTASTRVEALRVS